MSGPFLNFYCGRGFFLDKRITMRYINGTTRCYTYSNRRKNQCIFRDGGKNDSKTVRRRV